MVATSSTPVSPQIANGFDGKDGQHVGALAVVQLRGGGHQRLHNRHHPRMLFTDLAYHRSGVPPLQQEFIDAVAARHASSHPELFSLFRWLGTEARLQRAYPSFVREAHLALLLEERGLRCWRSEDGDQLDGIDILIVRDRYAIGLSTYVATERGQALRLSKLRRRPLRGLHLDVPPRSAGGAAGGPIPALHGRPRPPDRGRG